MKNIVRAFIAIDITPAIRNELIRIQTELKKSLKGNIAWINPQNIHLTLKFLGQINIKQLEEIKNIVEETAKKIKKFNMDLGVIGAFPNTAHPRIIWIGISYGLNQLNELNAVLRNRLETINFAPEDKHFHPHLSIARVKSIEGNNTLYEITQKIHPKQLSEIVNRIIIYKSELTHMGAKYSELFESKLSK